MRLPLIILPTTLYDEYINGRKLIEQKNPVLHIVTSSPFPEHKSFDDMLMTFFLLSEVIRFFCVNLKSSSLKVSIPG